jgi:hypothetical protein
VLFEKEVGVLKEIKSQGIKQLVSHGVTKDNHSYIIMKKFGSSLGAMLGNSKFGRFSLKTAV